MYLDKKYYVRNWNHMKDEEKHGVTILKGGQPSPIPVENIIYIVTEAVYWRKANAIHRWFVDNIQDCEDNCERYYVDREKLEELLDLVNKVLENHNLASELLPTQEGFFFGTYEYDQDYFGDLEYTKRKLERILAVDDGGEFEYHASW